MERYKDFDKFFAEIERKPIIVKIFGKEYVLPPALPAVVILKTIRLRKEGASVFPPEALFEMAEGIFGQEVLNELINKGIDMDQLGELIKWVSEQYMVKTASDSGN